MSAKSSEAIVYIGSYGSADETTIRVCRYDSELQKLAVIQEINEAENASYLALHPNGELLYAVSETEYTEGSIGGSAIAYRIDPISGKLTEINRGLTRGAHPCYVSTDAKGRRLYIANYTGGNSATLQLNEDGSIGKELQITACSAPLGPNAARQEAPHAHAIVPNGKYVYVTDLGTDSIHIYEQEEGESQSYRGAVKLHAGAGPRHLVFHETLPYAYAVNELDSTVTVFKTGGTDGALEPVQTVSALPSGYADYSDAADIHLAPSGRYLYSSNRGHDSIAVFAVDQTSGKLTLVQTEPCGGQTPRNFAIAPDGGHMFVAHQKTGTIALFSVDKESGRIAYRTTILEANAPVCIAFGRG
ncbi:lactonase family protein [Paenibacillus sp. NEAU-GSW1]|uniref:lactonase family protein n=1 Tax=Paenibacillus sp. NEAU-GSW1 TaxID=2682486 RepID=UPI0012E26060|nr:lactonase family protein [Paenibacillus sp. NEAU-GSW1]MUT67790.1 beta-propeller fold lactonase family protein [Paenibacillus sp. NEAU-GSW1]